MAIDIPPALQSFADVPYIVQAAAPEALDLARRGAIALAAIGQARPYVAMGEYRRRSTHNQGANAQEPVAGSVGPAEAGMPEDKFNALIASIETRVDRELPKVKGYNIAVFNSAAKDYGAEIKRVMGKAGTPAEARGFGSYYKAMSGGQGGFSITVGEPHKDTCLVVGMRPTTTVAGMVGRIANEDGPHLGKASTGDLHAMLQWHEVGHCLMGGSEIRADVFGALVAVQSGVSRDTVAAIANGREADELLRGDPEDNHVTSQGLAWVARVYDKLRADPEFMKMDVLNVAKLARTVADKYALSPADLVNLGRVRLANQILVSMESHHVVDAGGVTSMNTGDYIKAHAGQVTVFQRLVDLKEKAAKDLTVPPSAFKFDFAAYKDQLKGMAAKGDPTAKAMVRALSAPIPEIRIGPDPTVYSLADKQDFAARFFAMDTGGVKLTYSQGQGHFSAEDGSGTVALYDAAKGEKREFVPQGVEHGPSTPR